MVRSCVYCAFGYDVKYCLIIKYKKIIGKLNKKELEYHYLHHMKERFKGLTYFDPRYFDIAIEHFYPQHIKTINKIKLLR